VPNLSEVFKDKGAKPGAWDELPRDNEGRKVFENLPAQQALARQLQSRLDRDETIAEIVPSVEAEEGAEVRMNQITYETVIAETLYNIEGLEAKFRSRSTIEFPREAKEVKAQWVRIQDSDKPKYHWRTVRVKSATTGAETVQLWGLEGLHLITRDVPNWFWCDFEHVDFEQHAELPSRDTTTRGVGASGGRDGVRNETKGSKWENYRLRGTQIDFTDSQGRTTLLANTVIEHGFQQTSSCITCHARATIGLRGDTDPVNRPNTLPVFESVNPVLIGSVASPNPRWFLDERSRPKYIQSDFLWSLPFRAISTSDPGP
jgi:hypothetical protein